VQTSEARKEQLRQASDAALYARKRMYEHAARVIKFRLSIPELNFEKENDGKGELCAFFASMMTDLREKIRGFKIRKSNSMGSKVSIPEDFSVHLPEIGVISSASQNAIECDSNASASSIRKILEKRSRAGFLEVGSALTESK